MRTVGLKKNTGLFGVGFFKFSNQLVTASSRSFDSIKKPNVTFVKNKPPFTGSFVPSDTRYARFGILGFQREYNRFAPTALIISFRLLQPLVLGCTFGRTGYSRRVRVERIAANNADFSAVFRTTPKTVKIFPIITVVLAFTRSCLFANRFGCAI